MSLPPRTGDGTDDARVRRFLELLTAHTVSHEERAGADASPWPSPCALHAPRVRSLSDKRCRLAKDIARALFPHDEMLATLHALQRAEKRAPPPPVPAAAPLIGS